MTSNPSMNTAGMQWTTGADIFGFRGAVAALDSSGNPVDAIAVSDIRWFRLLENDIDPLDGFLVTESLMALQASPFISRNRRPSAEGRVGCSTKLWKPTGCLGTR